MTTISRKIILFEVNEVPFRVFDDFIENNPDSCMADFFRRSKQFETICEDQIELDPWISWPTLHRGVVDLQHKILHLGQSLEQANNQYPNVWDLLALHGKQVGIFGSLHSSTAPKDWKNYKFYVPDFFANTSFAYPQSLETFQQFNLTMTRRSGRNVDDKIPWTDVIPFLRKYLLSGMSFSTIRSILSVLWSEYRLPYLKCRRRSLQPIISLDVFLNLMKKSKTDFATFHTNHVASAMHRFWAAAFPKDIDDNPMPEEWQKMYKDEIPFAMKVLDQMIARLKTFADQSDSLLLLTTSLGQSAIRSEATPGFLTITNIKRFMARMGLAESEWQERFAMVPCISVIVDPLKADEFETNLRSIQIEQHSMMQNEREIPPLSYDRKKDSFQLYVYFEGQTNLSGSVSLGDLEIPFEDMGIGFFEHEEKVACSGRHTPFGSLIVYDPRKSSVSNVRSQISTLDIAPAILHNFQIMQPAYMNLADADLLDVDKAGTKVSLTVHGGGIETPVIRAA